MCALQALEGRYRMVASVWHCPSLCGQAMPNGGVEGWPWPLSGSCLVVWNAARNIVSGLRAVGCLALPGRLLPMSGDSLEWHHSIMLCMIQTFLGVLSGMIELMCA